MRGVVRGVADVVAYVVPSQGIEPTTLARFENKSLSLSVRIIPFGINVGLVYTVDMYKPIDMGCVSTGHSQ